MKDIKIQTVRSVTDSLSPAKTGKKENIADQSFNDTLNTTIARMTDLKNQANVAIIDKETKAASIKDEISSAKEIFDKMMLEKKNLSQLYHRIKNPEES